MLSDCSLRLESSGRRAVFHADGLILLRLEKLLVIGGQWISGLVKLRFGLSVVAAGLGEVIAGHGSSAHGDRDDVLGQGRISGQQSGQLFAIDNDALGSLGTAAVGLSHSGIGRVTVAMVMMVVMAAARITPVLPVLRISAILGVAA